MCKSLIPCHCSEWRLLKHVDLMKDSLEYLSQSFQIVVGRDDHCRMRCERHSLFAYITDPDEMNVLLNRFGDKLIEYHNEDGGNVLHEIVRNPNYQCYFALLNRLSDEDVMHLANERDRFGDLPIMCTLDVKIFEDLFYRTAMDPAAFSICMSNSYSFSQYVLNLLQEHGIIHY